MAALWTQQAPSYQGKYVSFDKVDAHPRPVRPDGSRIVIGGRTPAAFRRAVARGHGWVGIGTVDELDFCLDGLREAAAEVDRPAHCRSRIRRGWPVSWKHTPTCRTTSGPLGLTRGEITSGRLASRACRAVAVDAARS